MVVLVTLPFYLCSHCPRVFTAEETCASHELERHAEPLPPDDNVSAAESLDTDIRDDDRPPPKCKVTLTTVDEVDEDLKLKRDPAADIRRPTPNVDLVCSAVVNGDSVTDNEHKAVEGTQKPAVVKQSKPKVDLDDASLRIHKCTFCNKAYKRASVLKVHERKHTGERPYLCRLSCGLAFKDSSNRNGHERTHDAASYKFACDLCDKKFAWVTGVVDHRLSHTGRKNAKCTMCEYAAKNVRTLRYHLRRIHGHGEPTLRCEVSSTCKTAFFSKGEKLKHEVNHRARAERYASQAYNRKLDACGGDVVIG